MKRKNARNHLFSKNFQQKKYQENVQLIIRSVIMARYTIVNLKTDFELHISYLELTLFNKKIRLQSVRRNVQIVKQNVKMNLIL